MSVVSWRRGFLVRNLDDIAGWACQLERKAEEDAKNLSHPVTSQLAAFPALSSAVAFPALEPFSSLSSASLGRPVRSVGNGTLARPLTDPGSVDPPSRISIWLAFMASSLMHEISLVIVLPAALLNIFIRLREHLDHFIHSCLLKHLRSHCRRIHLHLLLDDYITPHLFLSQALTPTLCLCPLQPNAPTSPSLIAYRLDGLPQDRD